jgi:predicted porin
MSRLTRGLFLILMLLSCASQAWAEFTLTPGITLRQEYNDNIYLDADNEEDDFITTLTPTLLVSWGTPRIDLSLDARIMFQKYANNSDEDRIGPGEADQGSTFNALVRVIPDIFFLRVSDTYQRVPIDEGDRGGEGNNSVNLTDSNRLTINPYLQFVPLSDLQLKLGYAYENLWYGNEDSNDPGEDDSGVDDSESHEFSLALTKPLSARVAITLSGSRLLYRPKDPSERWYLLGEQEGTYEYDRDSVRVVLDYQVSDTLRLSGGYGHSWLDYDVREDTDSDIWEVSADYELSSTLTTGIAYSSDYSVSVEDGPSEHDRLSAYLAYDDRMEIRLSVFVANQDYVEIDRQSDSYGGDISGTLPFTDRYGLDWGLSYDKYDESSSELRLAGTGDSISLIDTSEEYDRYGVRLAFYYDISMGRLSAGYIYTRNESDSDESDYTNNILYLQASLTF